MVNQFEDIAQSIINAHPESVRLLLASKGITKPATPEVLKNAYVLFGKPFLAELVNVIYIPKLKVSNVSGEEDMYKTTSSPSTSQIPPAVTAGTEKKTIFDKIAGIFESVTTAIKTVENLTTPKKYYDPTTGQLITQEQKEALEKAQQEKQAKTMLIVGGLIILTLVLVFTLFKKSR